MKMSLCTKATIHVVSWIAPTVTSSPSVPKLNLLLTVNDYIAVVVVLQEEGEDMYLHAATVYS